MFNDRDLFYLGAGAVGAVVTLILPIPLMGKVIIAVVVLMIFTVIALLRIGPDRVPLEEFLKRRIMFKMQTRQYVYNGSKSTSPAASAAAATSFASDAPAAASGWAAPSMAMARPMTLAWEEVGIYWLVTAWLTVIATYFVYWLATGGSSQLGYWLQHFRP